LNSLGQDEWLLMKVGFDNQTEISVYLFIYGTEQKLCPGRRIEVLPDYVPDVKGFVDKNRDVQQEVSLDCSTIQKRRWN
jgi:hypothetical protein